MPQSSRAKPDITLIVTAHREGVIDWPGLRSAERQARFAREAGYDVSVCLVLDRADQETARLAQLALATGLIDQLELADVGDVGLSRHVGLAATTSELVAIMDADDLFGDDWLVAGATTWQAGDGRDIVHPEWRLFFGGVWGWQRFIPQNDPRWQPQQQTFVYDYSSAVFASRQAWLDCPYQPSIVGSGFGHEDWHWGLELIARGYRHTIAPNTVRFYRHRPDSICQQHNAHHALIRPTAFFDLPLFRELGSETAPRAVAAAAPSKWGNYRRRVGEQWRAAIRVTIDPIARRWRTKQRVTGGSHPGNQPKLCQDWVEASRLEPALANPWMTPDKAPLLPVEYRAAAIIQSLPRLLNDWDAAVKQAGGPITHAIFAPWIMQSGADRATAEYARAIRVAGGRPVLIITERSLVELGVLPSDLPVIDAAWLNELPTPDRLLCLARLILQRQPPKIILINSIVGWETVSRYAPAIATTSEIWGVAFTDDELPDHRRVSWPKLFLPNCLPHLTGILTDTNSYRLDLERTFGLPDGLATTVYTPIPVYPGDFLNHESTKRVLWVGRFDRQKRPDRLIRLARRLPHVDFEVWGRGYMEDAADITERLQREPNIHLRGGYSRGFGELVEHDRYNAFIYTAQWDGLPIIILEAVAAGLPIVTTNSGGVAEIIDSQTGWLVEQEDGPDAFVAALRECLDNQEEAVARATRARERLAVRHGSGAWLDSLQKVRLLSTTKQKPNELE